MKYLELAEVYENIEASSKRLDKTSYIARLLMKAQDDDIPKLCLLIQGKIFPDWDDKKIGVAARLAVKAISRSSGQPESKVEDIWREEGDLGLVAQKLIKSKVQATLASVDLTLNKVYANISKLAELEGAGSVDRKLQLISELLTSASPVEAKYIIRTVLEDLRVGVGDGSIRDAIAWAYFPRIDGLLKQWDELRPGLAEPLKGIEDYSSFKGEAASFESPELARKAYNALTDNIQSAYDVLNEFSKVAIIARDTGMNGLAKVELAPGQPVKVMLAQKVASVADAFEKVGRPAALEYKYDGFRMQIHKKGSIVTLFTRRLEEVSKQFPEVVVFFKELKGDFILDGEAVGYDSESGKYMPFQHISQRIRRKHGIDEMAEKLPVELNLFDILSLNGKTMISEPLSLRRKALEGLIKPVKGRLVLAKQIITDKDDAASAFYQESLDKGNEGIMFKSLDSAYKPGSRVGFMVKLKPTMESLDLVITGSEWGEGKRANWLTSFTLSCVQDGEFLEIGKVGTGIKELEGEAVSFDQLTELLRPLIKSQKGREVILKPKLVVEIKFEEIQKSSTYGSGYALRFPRMVRIREDLSADYASGLDMIEELYSSQ